MPVQVLGIVGAIGVGFTQLTAFIYGLATLKTACAVVFIAATIALTTAMAFALGALLALIVEYLPPEVLAFIAAVIPANFIICATSVYSARTTRWVYDKNIATIKRICA